jgi:hypothetical protein
MKMETYEEKIKRIEEENRIKRLKQSPPSEHHSWNEEKKSWQFDHLKYLKDYKEKELLRTIPFLLEDSDLTIEQRNQVIRYRRELKDPEQLTIPEVPNFIPIDPNKEKYRLEEENYSKVKVAIEDYLKKEKEFDDFIQIKLKSSFSDVKRHYITRADMELRRTNKFMLLDSPLNEKQIQEAKYYRDILRSFWKATDLENLKWPPCPKCLLDY